MPEDNKTCPICGHPLRYFSENGVEGLTDHFLECTQEGCCYYVNLGSSC